MELILNPIFTSHMVLQANKPIRIFGNGIGRVTVEFLGTKKSIVSNGEEWELELPCVDYGGPYTMKIQLNDEKIELSDVYMGDVFLLGGQSNMQFKLYESEEDKTTYKGNSSVRLFTVDRVEDEEVFHTRDGWVICEKENAGGFSAIGYHLGHFLATGERKIGLIACYQGASSIQPWMPREVAEKYPQTKAIKDYPIWNNHGFLYEAMLSKILPFQISHVLWYQGESNAFEGEAELYLQMLNDMILSWRKSFKSESLPFIVIQIADYFEKENDPWWEMIQRLQLEAEKEIPNVKSVICRDICESDNIHPKTKDKLAKRIASIVK